MYLISGCVLLICLLESATVLPKEGGAPCDCPCPKPPLLHLTEDAVAKDCCNSSGRFRYKCLLGYLRKAGTSNMAKCSILNGAPNWTTPSLVCIPDPRVQTSVEPGTSPGPPGQDPVPNVVPVQPSTNRTDHETPADRGTGEPPTTDRAGEFPGRVSTNVSLTQATSSATQVYEGSGDQRQASPPPDGGERTSVATVPTVVSVLLVVLVASAVLSFVLWKRRRSGPAEEEPVAPERIPMNPPGE